MVAVFAATLISCSQRKEDQAIVLFDEKDFTMEVNGKVTDLFTLKAGDLVMQVTNFGGRVVSLWVPDKDGKYEKT